MLETFIFQETRIQERAAVSLSSAFMTNVMLKTQWTAWTASCWTDVNCALQWQNTLVHQSHVITGVTDHHQDHLTHTAEEEDVTKGAADVRVVIQDQGPDHEVDPGNVIEDQDLAVVVPLNVVVAEVVLHQKDEVDHTKSSKLDGQIPVTVGRRPDPVESRRCVIDVMSVGI